MSAEQGATSAGASTTYADLRRQRTEEPRGGNFLSAKGLNEGTTVDVKVTGTEIRPGYKPLGYTGPEPGPDPYWQVEAEGHDGSVLVKENRFMSDWLDENNVDEPTGVSFRLVVILHKGNKTFKVSRKL